MAGERQHESGFTMVEVLVAMVILAIGAMTTFSLLTAATRNAQRAKGSQVALEYAEQELEFLRSLEDKSLALTVAPPHADKVLSPDYRVSNGTFALTRQPIGSYQNLVINGGSLYGGGEIAGGTISPGPTPFTSGDVKGKVYRYIVWRNDPKCSETTCPGKQDYKQIVVAVKLDVPPNRASETGYYEVQSNFIDPTDNPEKDPMPTPNTGVVTAQQFFLTDTPCSLSGVTVRQEISGNHLLHNTLGTCASGLQTGTTLGAPDALLLGSPPDPDPTDPKNPLEYDYANDSYLNTTSGTDQGLLIRKGESTGCNYQPTDKSNPQAVVHRWVTDPMAQQFMMTGKATLQFYTGALGTSAAPGKICVFLFKRREEGSPPTAFDTRLTNTSGSTPYWTYSPSGNWPGEWTKVRLTMSLNGTPYPIAAGERLGLALGVEAAGTTAAGISFLYDHPDRLTRLEIDTTTPIDGG
jgi:prepilin-type N-terminal cleavage/methylation domain-containing protein